MSELGRARNAWIEAVAVVGKVCEALNSCTQDKERATLLRAIGYLDSWREMRSKALDEAEREDPSV